MNVLIEDDKLEFKLERFEGPLDLLLKLIDRAEIDIMDIFISDIIEQYLALMPEISESTMPQACEFVAMAARLLAIKVHALLPVENVECDIENEDDASELIRKLKEYKLLKEASDDLKKQETLNRFYRMTSFTDDDTRFVVKNFSLDAMLDAFARMINRIQTVETEEQPKEIVRDRFTVSERMEDINDTIIIKRRVKFTEMFEIDFTKSEMISTFLAMLELLKQQFITVEQDEQFGEIYINYKDREVDTIGKIDADY